MSFRFDIDELFNGDLSQYDSNDFSELNSVFQPGFNRSNSLYSSNNEQQLPLTTLTTTKLSMNLKNTDNGNKIRIEIELEKINEQLQINNFKQQKQRQKQIQQQQQQQQKQKQTQFQQQQQQQQKNTRFNNFIHDESVQETQRGKSKYGRNIRSKFRKRDLKKPNQVYGNNERKKFNNRENSTIVESGKEVYKLLVGVLWVMSGGASLKILTPYSDKIAKKIGNTFNASENEEVTFKKQLKYLLTNSRRTFTEYILEILIGILSLRFIEEKEKEKGSISIEFWETLTEIVEIDSLLKTFEQKQSQNENQNENENEKMKKIKRREELHSILQKIYHKVFTPKILMFWFNKRFIDRLDAFFDPEIAGKFYKEHFCYFGKSKFMLSCLILASELVNQDGIAKRYSELIDLEYESDPLNLYSNNRGKKQSIVKELIVKYQLNGGQYWKVLSGEYMKQIKFEKANLFDYFPFKEIISNPLLASLCKGSGQQMLTQKKRVLATKGNVIEDIFNIGWIMKKEN